MKCIYLKERLHKKTWMPFDIPFLNPTLAAQDTTEYSQKTGRKVRVRCYVRMAEEAMQWTPAVEKYRKALMGKFADRCSMEQIATAAYILGGKSVRRSGEAPQEKQK